MRVALTGATGFVGSHLAEALLAAGHSLTCLVRSPARAAPLRDAVLQVAPGNARLVSAGGGHTIVMVIAREPAGQRDLTMPTVRDRITQTLRARKEQLLRAAYLTAVQNDADIVNHLARQIVETQGKLSK